MGTPEIPRERKAAQQRVSLPQVPIKKELEIKWLLTSQAAFKSSHDEFDHYVLRSPYKKIETILNCSFHISLSGKKISKHIV